MTNCKKVQNSKSSQKIPALVYLYVHFSGEAGSTLPRPSPPPASISLSTMLLFYQKRKIPNMLHKFFKQWSMQYMLHLGCVVSTVILS